MTAVVLAFPVAVVRRVNRKGYAVLIVPAELGRRQGRVRSRLEYTYSVVAIDGTLGRVRPGNATEAAMEAKLVLKLA
ncbi:hypothetical protein PoMZ_02879 [Pyricularia oryzae]|uniref:Uncharacterized protein n=1 Tax=Pyricularia oryzae TaxID=318829 RepID=A0A4P7N9F1_PYROR|nr:hypothetical protein PoMZ_02879 [Pyricularia oryzae]